MSVNKREGGGTREQEAGRRDQTRAHTDDDSVELSAGAWTTVPLREVKTGEKQRRRTELASDGLAAKKEKSHSRIEAYDEAADVFHKSKRRSLHITYKSVSTKIHWEVIGIVTRP